MDAESKERGRDYLAADIFLTAARLGGDAAIPITQGDGAAREEVSCARNGAPACKETARSSAKLVSDRLVGGHFLTPQPPRNVRS